MGSKRGHNCILTVALCTLFYLDHCMEISAAPFGKYYIFHFGHTSDRAIDFRLVGASHEDLVLVTTGENAMVDKIRFCIHTGKLDYRLAPDRVIGSGDVDKRTFVSNLTPNVSFKNNFCTGRDTNTIAAFFHLK